MGQSPSAAAMHSVVREILDSWQNRPLSNLHTQRHAVTSEAHLPLTYGMTAHAHLMAESALALLQAGQVLQAYPLVRVVYECALRAQWIANSGDAAEGMVNELERQRAALGADLQLAASPILSEGASSFSDDRRERLETTADAAARHFKTLCHSLEPGGTDAYVYYRFMSDYSHASIRATDGYLTVPEQEGAAPVALRVEPPQPDADLPAAFLAYSLVWAGSAFDLLIAGRPRRKDLEAFATQLQIPVQLRIRADVLQRVFAAQKAAKDARRAKSRKKPAKPD